MSLKDRLIELGKNLPAQFQPQQDGTLATEYVVAERRWLLSRKKVTYRCRVRVDEARRAVRMFEMLKESGFGLSSSSDDIGPGFGFKKETCKTTGPAREGGIDEQARLLGRQYKCEFDFSAVRNVVKQAATEAGYAFSMCLTDP
ncbi:MAG: hypothetical protein N2689_11335 [Verrucomicrobiae bacterium]|nr:hypothetical protein [Verrucomicrobiae bacterium]